MSSSNPDWSDKPRPVEVDLEGAGCGVSVAVNDLSDDLIDRCAVNGARYADLCCLHCAD